MHGGPVAAQRGVDARDSAVTPLSGGDRSAESARMLTLAAAGERAEQLLNALREDNLADAARN